MSDEYAKVSKGKLKLKSDSEISKKKKKKKDKDREREKIANTSSETINIAPETSTGRKLTKAEQSFKKMQDKMVSTWSSRDQQEFGTSSDGPNLINFHF